MAFRNAATIVVARIFKLLDSTGVTRIVFGPKTILNPPLVGSSIDYKEPGWPAGMSAGTAWGTDGIGATQDSIASLYAERSATQRAVVSVQADEVLDQVIANMFAANDAIGSAGVTAIYEEPLTRFKAQLSAFDGVASALLMVSANGAVRRIDLNTGTGIIDLTAGTLLWNGAGWQNWNPVLSQPGVVAATIGHARYFRFGPLVFFNYRLGVTGAGVAGQVMTVSLPIPHTGVVFMQCGSGTILDVSVPIRYNGTLGDANIGGNICYVTDATIGNAWGAIPFIAIGAGDVVEGWGMYQCA